MKRSTKTVLVAGALAGMAGGLLGAPAKAEAKWQRYNAAVCLGDYGISNDQGDVVYGGGLYGVINTDTDWQKSVVCPIDDSSSFTKGEIRGVNVHVYDGNDQSNIYAKTCTKNFNEFSASCSSSVNTSNSFVGETTLSPSVANFTSNEGGFAYLLVTLGKRDPDRYTGYYSGLNGFFTYD